MSHNDMIQCQYIPVDLAVSTVVLVIHVIVLMCVDNGYVCNWSD